MENKQTKYIFVTGGVLSGVGKGIAASSIGNLLKASGLTVNIQKCDPYLNVDAGTLNPSEHGEVFVTKDGAETDLDLGHYERFLDQELSATSSLMSGKVLSQVIDDERAGQYLGKTVQIIPHVTNAMQERIIEAGTGYDVHIVEVGGTVGDYEGLAFIEAIREMRQSVGIENTAYVHVVYLPYLSASEEIKTKPAQNAVRQLRSLGINPDVLVARADYGFNGEVVAKLSMFGGVPKEAIAVLPNAKTVYEVPLTLKKAGTIKYLLDKLEIKANEPDTTEQEMLVKKILKTHKQTIKIGIVAKYMGNVDTYFSVFEALKSAAWNKGVGLDIRWLDSEAIAEGKERLSGYDGLVVPGGFGSRGIEGKIKAAEYAMKHDVPYLGLCLGMQVSVIALARKVIDKTANSLEFDPRTKHPVIHLMEEQKHVTEKGGTMRLGDYECVLTPGSKAHKLYGAPTVHERHRHRYEFNNAYRTQLEEAGMVMSGHSPDGELVEMIELRDHPFFMGSQFHPEYKSRPTHPHPMFKGFIEAICKRLK